MSGIELDKNSQGTLRGFKSDFIRPLDLRLGSNLDLKQREILLESFDLLQSFDLDSRFGPSCGISRLQRLERARKFGISLDPQMEKMIRNSSDGISVVDKLISNSML